VATALLQTAVLLATRRLDFSLTRTTTAVWLNYIILSPLAEELLFRRMAVDVLCQQYRSKMGIVFSAGLFSVFHWPWWILSGEQSLLTFVSLSATLFIYGLVFGFLYRTTGSLWAPLIPH
jgi:membrane protease YdiL (CAAX protease family)